MNLTCTPSVPPGGPGRKVGGLSESGRGKIISSRRRSGPPTRSRGGPRSHRTAGVFPEYEFRFFDADFEQMQVFLLAVRRLGENAYGITIQEEVERATADLGV